MRDFTEVQEELATIIAAGQDRLRADLPGMLAHLSEFARGGSSCDAYRAACANFVTHHIHSIRDLVAGVVAPSGEQVFDAMADEQAAREDPWKEYRREHDSNDMER